MHKPSLRLASMWHPTGKKGGHLAVRPSSWAAWCLVVAVCASGCATVISRKDRESARIAYDLGISAFDRGDSREALRDLLSAVRLDPALADAHNALGLLYHGMGKEAEALVHYEEATRLRPKFSEAFNNMGILLLDMGRYDEAIAAFKVALEDILYSTPTLAEGNLGWAYYRKGEVALAKERIGSAIAADPQFCRGYEWLMRIALDANDGAEAVAQGNRFVRHCANNKALSDALSPDYRREMSYYLALGHLKLGHTEQAIALLKECANLEDAQPKSPAARCASALRPLQ
jgi:type IV pilus assembly protein PilF